MNTEDRLNREQVKDMKKLSNLKEKKKLHKGGGPLFSIYELLPDVGIQTTAGTTTTTTCAFLATYNHAQLESTELYID